MIIMFEIQKGIKNKFEKEEKNFLIKNSNKKKKMILELVLEGLKKIIIVIKVV